MLVKHQNFIVINLALRSATPWGAYSLGQLVVTAEEDHVILDNDVIEKIASANDLNDAFGYYVVWLGKRVEAQGGGRVTDF